jgi:hypothetical protein
VVFSAFSVHTHTLILRATPLRTSRDVSKVLIVSSTLYSSLSASRPRGLPVIENEKTYIEKSPEPGSKRPRDEDYYYEDLPGYPDKPAKKEPDPISTAVKAYVDNNTQLELKLDDDYGYGFQKCDDIEMRWKILAMGRRIIGTTRFVEDAKLKGWSTQRALVQAEGGPSW